MTSGARAALGRKLQPLPHGYASCNRKLRITFYIKTPLQPLNLDGKAGVIALTGITGFGAVTRNARSR
jgi:hypothetical protein